MSPALDRQISSLDDALAWIGLVGGLVVWAIVLFLVMLLYVSLLGWAYYAKRYRCDAPPIGGIRYRFCSARFGWLGWYTACLNATVAIEGLYLRPVFPLWFCHPGILIPFKIMRSVRLQKSLLGRVTEVKVEDLAGRLRIILPADAAQRLHNASPPSALP